jgi:hypothetical protein
MLRRRTFLGLLAGFAGAILSLARAVRPSSWRKRETQSATPAANESGIKITTTRRWRVRNSIGDENDLNPEPDTFYLQGESRRLQYHRGYTGKTQPDGSSVRVYGPRIVMIARPDLEQMFELNLDASQYARMPYPPNQNLQPLTKEQLEARGIKMPPPGETAKPTFRIETVTKDTGERKEMFGYVARHVITTRREIPLEGSRRDAQEMTRDGWYIDLEPQLYPALYPSPKSNNLPDGKAAQSGRVHAYLSASVHRPGEGQQVPERPEFIDIGEPETGFALQELRTTRLTFTRADGSTGRQNDRAETLVTIEKGTYDAALFEVPSGFKRVPYINRNPA